MGIKMIENKQFPVVSMGSVTIMGEPTTITKWVNATTSGTASDLEMIAAGAFSSYASICTIATTTYANGGEIITFLVATSSEISALLPSIGPYAIADASKRGSGTLEYYHRCERFEIDRNLTSRAIYALATTTNAENRPYYVHIIYDQNNI